MLKSIVNVALASATIFASTSFLEGPHHMARTRRPVGYTNRGWGSIAGRAHNHQREITRRARQKMRIAQNRQARGVDPYLGDFRPEGVAGYTRRGNAVRAEAA